MTNPSTWIEINVAPQLSAAQAVAFFALTEKQGQKSSVRLLGGAVDADAAAGAMIKAEIVTGKTGEVVAGVGAGKGARVVVAGLGSRESLKVESIRHAGGALARYFRKHKLERAAVVVPEVEGHEPQAVAAALATGLTLAGVDYRDHRGTVSKSDQPLKPTRVTLVGPAGLKAPAARAATIALAQNYARAVASRPGNDINPVSLAREAASMARSAGLKCTIFDEKKLASLGMGGILAVGAGSIATPPRMIILEHRPPAAKKNTKPVLLVGKAITFDTGGISIKPAERMGRMIYDKCGGMTVLGVMLALARLKAPVHVVGILSSAENHISSRAYRPGDILKMYNGVTVEVTNTDAEGRLVLGDALAWGIETYKPRACVDLATLTGGVVVALGKTMAGGFANDDALWSDLTRALDASGEKIWRLPVGDEQREQMKASEHADLINSAGREGHPLQGAAFLSYFVPFAGKDKLPWAHLDIAGVGDTEKDMPYYAKGATGWGVRGLVEWLTGG